jgi:hypothetical protein
MKGTCKCGTKMCLFVSDKDAAASKKSTAKKSTAKKSTAKKSTPKKK